GGPKGVLDGAKSGAHAVLGQEKGGVSWFCGPRVRPDGKRNSGRLERLKDKLGNRSNASAEVEFQDAIGWRLGEEGEGIRHIIKMGGMTRLDCALGRHGLIRRAFSVCIHHAHTPQAFGKPLIDTPFEAETL
uniref:acyl-CoA dehydrogenase family protein n=1 Tax=Salmonella enterica TaxID=28901 RepID=UPI00398C54E3